MQLTEEETEYKVVCVRHVLDSHVVLQFNCTNTVREQVRGEWPVRPSGLGHCSALPQPTFSASRLSQAGAGLHLMAVMGRRSAHASTGPSSPPAQCTAALLTPFLPRCWRM